MLDINQWIEKYQNTVKENFKDRVLFIGLQGSYGRGEATENSDINTVLILDKVEIEDLQLYKNIIKEIPNRELLSSFISGKEEILNWNKSELFQIYNDTIPLYGKFEDFLSAFIVEDVKLAVLSEACVIYHKCSYNFIHEESLEKLKSLYKIAFFVMQGKYYCENNIYIENRKELIELLKDDDKKIMEISYNLGNINNDSFDEYSKLLLNWSSKLIEEYKY